MDEHPGSHFGKQMKKDRLRHGWTLDHLAKESGVNAAHLGRVESGKRPPTVKVAKALDVVFPDRRGWFLEYWQDLQRWSEVPSYFKPWAEYELTSKTLRAWSPMTMHGLLQTEAYAREQVSIEPWITAEQVAERVANRMARQRRVLYRDDPPRAHFLVSAVSLGNMPGSVRVRQLRHILTVSALPFVVMQVVPANVWHPGMNAGFVVSDTAAYTESLTVGQVYADDDSVSAFAERFDTIRREAMRVSESVALIKEMVNRDRLSQVKLLKRHRRRLRGSSE